MRSTLLLPLLAVSAWAADVCPAGEQEKSGSVAGVLEWSAHTSRVRNLHCVGSELRKQPGEPVEVVWPNAGMDRVVVGDRVEFAVCCFEHTEPRPAPLKYGWPVQETAAAGYHEVGEDPDAEGFPDLIEEDARERTVSIRGTLWGDGKPVRVDLLLRCSASKFADQYAYQFSVTNRSEDAVEVDWDLLRRTQAEKPLAAQPHPKGAAYVFLSAIVPRETRGIIQVKTKSGAVAGRFHADGFAPLEKGRQ
jgi:hypothetical protein